MKLRKLARKTMLAAISVAGLAAITNAEPSAGAFSAYESFETIAKDTKETALEMAERLYGEADAKDHDNINGMQTSTYLPGKIMLGFTIPSSADVESKLVVLMPSRNPMVGIAYLPDSADLEVGWDGKSSLTIRQYRNLLDRTEENNKVLATEYGSSQVRSGKYTISKSFYDADFVKSHGGSPYVIYYKDLTPTGLTPAGMSDIAMPDAQVDLKHFD